MTSRRLLEEFPPNKADPYNLRKISFRNEIFPTLQLPHLLQSSVMPVVVYNTKTRSAKQAGTCFAVSNEGLAITAYHVMEHALNLAGMAPVEKARVQGLRTGVVDARDEWLIAAFYVSSNAHSSEPNSLIGGLLPIARLYKTGNTDICFVRLSLPIHTADKQLLKGPAFPLSPGIPEENEGCFGLGYHSGFWHSTAESAPGKTTLQVSQTFSAARGSVEEIYFPQRDAVVLPFPSFRTSARFEAGMSGGPVIGKRGTVIGVITTGMEHVDSGCHIGHASLIGPALLTPIECQIERSARWHLFFEYACAGGAAFDETWKTGVSVERDGAAVLLDFGQSRKIVYPLKGMDI